MSQPIDIDQSLLIAWDEFVNRQNLLPTVSPLIANSWQRCWSRLNPYQKIRLSHLGKDYLLAAQVASFDMFSVARPVMEDIYQYVEESDTVVTLLNGAGYILDILGDQTLMDVAYHQGISTGALISESHIGTNAFSLAITERVPSRVRGAEHYLRQFHHLAEAAAPIFDFSGRPLGALGILNFAHQQTAHTLGLAVAGARAIEGQRQSDILLAEQNSHLAELNAILAANSEGILVWNFDHILMHVNASAARIIDIPSEALVGKRVDELFKYPLFIRQALEKQEPLTDVEANLQFGQRSINCVLSLRFVPNNKGLQWVIVTLRQEKDVRQLVQRQVGAQALLTLDDIPGESPEIRRVRRMVKSAAAAQASILIRGESGTGKNVLASAIHNESQRRDGPFLIFACSSVPNELIVSELLGYEEGLSKKRPGGRPSKFELAQGGTLFFQDVDALPLEAQGILLNVIELGIVQRLGSDRPIAVDVRVIAASSGDMEKLVAQGSFRADLYYRLGAFEITLPPLRDRQKDLPVLVDKILKRLSQKVIRPLSLAPGVIELLKEYHWPGNVRELEGVLGRAVVQAGNSEIINHLHLPVFIRTPTSPGTKNPDVVSIQPLDEIERDAFIQCAQICSGNVSEMARILGIGRTTVWRKLKEFNISVEAYRTKQAITYPRKTPIVPK